MSRTTTRTRRVRLTDVAQKLGLSTCTVSLALNGDPRISSQTCDRVRQMAAHMNYMPNVQARSLRTQRTKRIGVVLPELENPIYIEKVRAINNVAADNGYTLDFACTYWSGDKERQVIHDMIANQADALILLSGTSSSTADYIQLFAGQGRPVCMMSPVPDDIPGVSTIITDASEAMCKATEYLISLGHRTFGLVGIRTDDDALPSYKRRIHGVMRALHRAGLECDALVSIPFVGEVAEHGYEAIRLFLHRNGTLPSALLCLNDSVATGVLSGLYHHNIRVPHDVSVVGYDNIQASAYTIPPLTTLDQRPADTGKQAIHMLIEQLQDTNIQPRHILQVPELLVRQSTAPPAKGTHSSI